MLAKIRTVLINTSHPGNIGACARALKNTGLSQLYLVNPQDFPSSKATAFATSGKNILEKATVVTTLKEALHGCHLVYGTSARKRTLSWPVFEARDAAKHIITAVKQSHQEIAILYGCEKYGLSNEDLENCNYQIFIPTSDEYSSLNLSHAVQVINYELLMAYRQTDEQKSIDSTSESEIATFEEMDSFYKHLEKAMLHVRFLDRTEPGQLMARLKRIFSRAKPDKVELKILRGFLKNILTAQTK